MQDQEGFDNNEKVELVEFNYKPFQMHSEIKKKPIIKPQQGWLLTRDANRGQMASSIVEKEPQNVVYSPNINEIVMPENQILFLADFECSNLELVIRRRFLEYEIYLRPDTNTNSYFQWFDFRVKCLKNPKTVTFTIKNFMKAGMLYGVGLKPFFRRGSEGYYQQLQGQIRYFEYVPEDSYCLKFAFQFLAEGEEVQFCSQPPYSFSRLLATINKMKVEHKILCKSMMGKKVPYIVFNEQKAPKAIVIAIARQHPGESVGSWMMDGVMKRLEQLPNNSIQWLVIPMMCVDGVILGNNRTGLAGFDYNRYWNLDELNRRERTFPEIVSLLNLIKQIRRLHPRRPKLFLDLHGHSSQPNIFAYGPPHEINTQMYFMSRIFSELLARKNPSFSLQQCSYTIKPDKKNTARSLLFYQYLMPFVYTIEASFGIMRGKAVNQTEFIKFGEDLVEVTNDFLTNHLQGEKLPQTAALIEIVKARGEQNQAVEIDSDDGEEGKSLEKKSLANTERGCKQRVSTESPFPICRKDSEQTNFQLFRIEQTSHQHRYVKPTERKRINTEVGLSKSPKINFLPRLKQIQHKKMGGEMLEKEENVETSLMNIKEIQKRLHRLRNSRIGKKILIINSYGT